MARKPVTLGEYSFSTKKEAKAFYSEILNRVSIDQYVEGDDFEYVMALLLNHPRVEKKIGSGVAGLKVSTGHTASNRCFHVERTDGSIEDFSIGKCIDGDHSEFHKFCVACRKAVEKDVRIFKRNFFDKNADANGLVMCQGTKRPISFEEAHVDHREPFTFSAIVHFFRISKGIDLGSVEYETEGKYGNEFADQQLIESFRDWHRENAKLRIMHGKTNLGKGYLGRIKSTKADGTISP